MTGSSSYSDSSAFNSTYVCPSFKGFFFKTKPNKMCLLWNCSFIAFYFDLCPAFLSALLVLWAVKDCGFRARLQLVGGEIMLVTSRSIR